MRPGPNVPRIRVCADGGSVETVLGLETACSAGFQAGAYLPR